MFQSRRTALGFSHGPDSIHTEGRHRFPMTKKKNTIPYVEYDVPVTVFYGHAQRQVDESGTTSTITG